MPAVAFISSTSTWNCGPEYSAFNSLSFGLPSRASGETLVLRSTSMSFLIWMTMQRQTVCPWQMGLSLLSCRTIETWLSLVMGRMNPRVMFLYSMVQLKVIPWNRMLFGQKSTVYFPRGTARLTSSSVASDSPANSPILARSTICLQMAQAAPCFSSSFSSPSSSMGSRSSLGSSTWNRISHMQSSLPTSSTAVSTMMSCLLMVELLMAAQLMARTGWSPVMETRAKVEVSLEIRPQFTPLNDIPPAQNNIRSQVHTYKREINIHIHRKTQPKHIQKIPHPSPCTSHQTTPIHILPFFQGREELKGCLRVCWFSAEV